MATQTTPLPEPWTTHILSDSQHFTQTSQVGDDEPGLTAAKHSISLDLEDSTIANAIKAIVTKDIQKAAGATAEDPALAEYLSRLGISIPQGDSRNLAQRSTPTHNSSEDDENHKDDNPIIPDRLLRTSNASLSAGDGGRFPTLVAVTQACLNAQLHARWTAEVDLDRSELRNMVVPDGDDAEPSLFPDGVFINAELAAPQISLLVESEGSPSSALFYLKFLEGRCALWDEETGSLYRAPTTFGWNIAFKVDLQLWPMHNSFEYRCLASQWGLPPSYQINTLIVSFNKVTIDIPSSTFPTPLPPSVHACLADLVIANLCRRIIPINYAVTKPSASPATLQGPTVPPTALRLQTYPYRRSVLSKSGTVSTTSPVNGNPLNTLLYLPAVVTSPESQLPWSANWVASEVDEDISRSGKLVLGREAFLDSFLLPKLGALNKATHFEMKVAETKTTGAVQAEYKFSVGRNEGLGEEDFAWPKMDALNTGKGVLRYMWSRSSKISDQAGGNGFGSKVRGTTIVRNVLIVRGGTNRIRWETEAQVKLETELEIFGVTNKGVSTVWRKGAADLIVEEVDGKLGLRIDLHQGWVETGSTGGGTSFGFQGKELEKLRRELQMRYLNRDQIHAMVDGVNARFTRDWVWVYPAFGESFTMENPVFSDEHDLLVDLAYVRMQVEEEPY